VEDTEERVDRLEAIFGRFMTTTEVILREMRRDAEQHRREAEQFRREAEKDRQRWDRRLDEFNQRAEKDRADWQARAEKDREEARRERGELARQLGEISNRIGTLVEDIIAPSLRRMASEELGCGDELFFGPRVTRAHPDGSGRRREFDALYVGTQAVLLNESKATVRPEYAASFVEFLRSEAFFEYFPEYRGQPLVPVFSSLYLSADIVTYLTRHGIYAVAMGDEAMEVLNREQVSALRSAGATGPDPAEDNEGA
jgi:hypothetical protein